MLSNPTRYGLIACRYLVWGWHNNVWLNAPEIAARYHMNVRALSPALRRLVMAGILRSQCGGTRPGFMLSRAPEEVTMLEVVRALEGNFRMDCCRTVLPCVQCSCETVAAVKRFARRPRRHGRIFGGGKTLQTNKIINQPKNTGRWTHEN